MKKVLVLAALVTVLVSAAVSSAGGGATTVTTSSVSPIGLVTFVPCANGGVGEEVLINGNLHDLFHVTLDANGGFHLRFLDNPQGVTGTGLTTGDTYRGTGGTQDTFNGAVGSAETFVNNFRIIGQGPGNNLLVHENFHITVNPDGTVTSFHDNFTVECR
jgi:hypothetical protein